MAEWLESLKIGDNFEKYVLEGLNNILFPLAYKNMKKEDYSYYDIVLMTANSLVNYKTLECKYDYMASITGNICIEVACNGRLSGLLITKADYWIIGDGIKVYIIKKDRIRDCIVENPDSIKYDKACNIEQGKGVFKTMSIYLIPKRIFEKYCDEISDIENINFECLL